MASGGPRVELLGGALWPFPVGLRALDGHGGGVNGEGGALGVLGCGLGLHARISSGGLVRRECCEVQYGGMEDALKC